MSTSLQQLQPGQSATVTEVGGEGALRQHFLDMGIIPGEEVSLVKFAPMGDPMELRIADYALTIRLDDAKNISVADVHPTADNEITENMLEEIINKSKKNTLSDDHDKNYSVENNKNINSNSSRDKKDKP